MVFTIFTPTYNRGHLLPTLFESICRQKFKDIEWVVVDDGSTDNTQEVMDRIMAEKHDFPIRYFKTPNGGKHRAVNRGVRLAKGELFLILDSDDELPPNSIEIIKNVTQK